MRAKRSPFQARYGYRTPTLQIIKHADGEEWRGIIEHALDSNYTKDPSAIYYKFRHDNGTVIFLNNSIIKLKYGKNRKWYWEATDKAKEKIESEMKKAAESAANSEKSLTTQS